ncbi:MAG: YceD family protein [Zoogloeaceae bacterium]|jgi:uncharacterized protein|nr:YceD family protein [Zoogloeaceae bacterium]
MSQPFLIDAPCFSRESRQMAGVLALSELPRLHDLLAETSGQVTYCLVGVTGERQQARLRLEVSGVLPLLCQRCLGAVEERLAIDSLLELVPEDAEPTQEELEEDRLDFLPVAGTLDVKVLIEDEILLALPVAPRHDACVLPANAAGDERPHPFASLARLKGMID